MIYHLIKIRPLHSKVHDLNSPPWNPQISTMHKDLVHTLVLSPRETEDK